MSLDLHLLPFDHDSKDLCFSHTVLSCDQDYDFFDKIKEIIATESGYVRDDFSCLIRNYQEANIIEDAYGTRLKYFSSHHALRLLNDNTLTVKNKAIVKYLVALPINTKVAVYWH